jgi:hypothetical protein
MCRDEWHRIDGVSDGAFCAQTGHNGEGRRDYANEEHKPRGAMVSVVSPNETCKIEDRHDEKEADRQMNEEWMKVLHAIPEEEPAVCACFVSRKIVVFSQYRCTITVRGNATSAAMPQPW